MELSLAFCFDYHSYRNSISPITPYSIKKTRSLRKKVKQQIMFVWLSFS